MRSSLLTFALGLSLLASLTRGCFASSSSRAEAKGEWLKEPSTDVNDVEFLLYTRENPEADQILGFMDEESVVRSNFDGNRTTKILVHGYGDHGRVSWVMNVKNQFLEREDCNVISINWEALAGPSPFYFIAAENSKRVGYHVGDFMEFLEDLTGADLDSFHPVGFSLGGQLVGHLGHRLEGQLPRITGLDPAGFLFHTVPDSERLSKSSAVFVDVIHTAGLWIGTDEVVGHVDFYPNNGMAPQPGCLGEDIGLGCSHARAPAFFGESINSVVGFEAVKCPSWFDFELGLCDNAVEHNMMGEPANPASPGVYYLRTNSEPPYALPPAFQNLGEVSLN